nr:MAG TPA: hypothetical protein [Inoviridae sp.]
MWVIRFPFVCIYYTTGYRRDIHIYSKLFVKKLLRDTVEIIVDIY